MSHGEKAVDLDHLINSLSELFSTDLVDIEKVKQLMSSYQSNPKEWRKYAHFDRHRYTRNLVDTGNGKYNLILLCWSPGQGSSIHDHANSHCFMKIMSGSLVETQFQWPEDKEVTSDNDYDDELKIISSTTYKCDQVTYINDSIGLHRVENMSHVEPAVSLHLYSPAITNCRIFDQRTGKSTQVSVTFHSESGIRTPFKVTEKKGFLLYESNEKNGGETLINSTTDNLIASNVISQGN
ncbi:cysteine dioxygenase type 1-like [Panonychus citri]|uniref:cysteine dioxygenase type 1-like n=1 Tax=Panonychus citri TaxID=50023 RepID=UPI0023075414|nr:cysteine dioxygenase type 1-like [Panonychus citri]